jgi:hypothetical protein
LLLPVPDSGLEELKAMPAVDLVSSELRLASFFRQCLFFPRDERLPSRVNNIDFGDPTPDMDKLQSLLCSVFPENTLALLASLVKSPAGGNLATGLFMIPCFTGSANESIEESEKELRLACGAISVATFVSFSSF